MPFPKYEIKLMTKIRASANVKLNITKWHLNSVVHREKAMVAVGHPVYFALVNLQIYKKNLKRS